MANRKMFPRPPRVKAPPPPLALEEIRKQLDTAVVRPTVSVLQDGVVVRFGEAIECLLMTPKGARGLAAALVQRADELDRQTAGQQIP